MSWFRIWSLKRRVRRSGPYSRIEAAKELGRMRSTRAVKTLVAALTDSESAVRAAAAKALGEIADKRAIDPLIIVLEDPRHEVRSNAAKALGNIRDNRASQPLIAALNNARLGVCEQAANALGELGELSFDPLITALRNSNVEIRESGAKGLGTLRDKRAVKALIVASTDDQFKVRRAVAATLGRIGDIRAVPVLIGMLNDFYVKESAASALALLGPDSVDSLITALKSHDVQISQSAAVILGKIADKRAVESLIEVLNDSRSAAHAHAASALEMIVGERAARQLLPRGYQEYRDWLRSVSVIEPTGGTGHCLSCGGTGKRTRESGGVRFAGGKHHIYVEENCPDCNGTGR